MPLYDSTLVPPCLPPPPPPPLQPASLVPGGKRSASGPGGGGGSASPLGRPQAELRLGLSQAHISSPAHFVFAVGGRIAKLSNPNCLHTSRPPTLQIVPGAVREFPTDTSGPGSVVWEKKKRGLVEGFSRQSRIRMMQKLAGVNHRDMKYLPVMCTLTYPGVFPTNPAEYKKHLDRFHVELLREYGPIGVVWKLEFQVRGAAHFHLLLYFDDDTPLKFAFRQWCKRTWYRIVGSNDSAHLDQGAWVEPIKTPRGVQSYISKYVAKVVDGVKQNVGRWWGVWSWSSMPVELVEVLITQPEFYRLRRVFAGVRRSHDVSASIAARNTGLWLFMCEEEARRVLDWVLQ